MKVTGKPLQSPVNAYAQAIASGVGHEAALEAVFEEGERAGLRRADDALNWSTTCLGCADQLGKSYADFSSGEESGFRRALDTIDHVPVHANDDPVDLVAIIRYRIKKIIAEYERPPVPDDPA